MTLNFAHLLMHFTSVACHGFCLHQDFRAVLYLCVVSLRSVELISHTSSVFSW